MRTRRYLSALAGVVLLACAGCVGGMPLPPAAAPRQRPIHSAAERPVAAPEKPPRGRPAGTDVRGQPVGPRVAEAERAPPAPAVPGPAAEAPAAEPRVPKHSLTAAPVASTRGSPAPAPPAGGREAEGGRPARPGAARISGEGPTRPEAPAPAGRVTTEEGASGVGVVLLGMLVAAAISFVGWLALQPPWARERVLRRLRGRLHALVVRLWERRPAGTTITTSWSSPGESSFVAGEGDSGEEAGSAGKKRAELRPHLDAEVVTLEDSFARVGEDREDMEDKQDKEEKGLKRKRRAKAITNATLPIVRVPPKER